MRIALTVLAAALLTACTPSTPPPPTTVTGTMTVPGISPGGGFDPRDGAPCSTVGGYVDIRQGAQVTVTDDTGRVVGLGQLTPGRLHVDDGFQR